MSRYLALEEQLSVLKKENERLGFALHEAHAPERTTAGLIDKLQGYIEDSEWEIVRHRATIKTYEAAISALRKTLREKRMEKRAKATK